ncbi:transposase [Myxococcota bacterium]|nr:transposase [Myxococcota bacterium]
MARRGYPAEFRRRMIELIEAGRSISELSKELDVSQQTI